MLRVLRVLKVLVLRVLEVLRVLVLRVLKVLWVRGFIWAACAILSTRRMWLTHESLANSAGMGLDIPAACRSRIRSLFVGNLRISFDS